MNEQLPTCSVPHFPLDQSFVNHFGIVRDPSMDVINIQYVMRPYEILYADISTNPDNHIYPHQGTNLYHYRGGGGGGISGPP